MNENKGKELSISERRIIVHLRESGKSYGQIAQILNKSRSTVQRVVKNFNNTKSFYSKERNGRPKKIGKQEEKFIVREVRRTPRTSLKKLTTQLDKYFDTKVHPSTVSRALHRAEYKSCIARKKPYISDTNRKKRINFAKEYKNKDFSFWSKVMFSDESKYNLFGSDGRQLVWRQRNKELDPKNLQASVKHGGGGVMVWGCMSAAGVGNLVIIDDMIEITANRTKRRLWTKSYT